MYVLRIFKVTLYPECETKAGEVLAKNAFRPS